MTYVDDIFVAAEEEVSAAVIEAIRQKWKTSEPDVVGEKPIRFLGMEVTKVKNQETGREEWYVTQESFIKDLLQKDPEEIKKRKIPITRDQSLMPAELEENRTPEGIRGTESSRRNVMAGNQVKTRPHVFHCSYWSQCHQTSVTSHGHIPAAQGVSQGH